MSGYPAAIVPVDHVEPSARRVRGVLAGRVVFDTTGALYVWEWPPYPQYYVPVADVAPGLLVDSGEVRTSSRGTAAVHAVVVGAVTRPGAALVHTDGPLAGTVRFEWAALDAWYEEDEQVFVHPRSPYARVDAVRSTRHVRVSLDGVRLADTSSPVFVFETGLPTRYYVNRTEVDLDRLRPSDTVTSCPYKGRTSAYWSVAVGGNQYPDLAWAYDFPTAALLPIAGLVCFYNEKVDIAVDGIALPRPATHFS